MPAPVRRKTLVLVFALGAALAFAAVAYAGNGGFAPKTPHSPNADRINDSYKWISLFAILILIVVEGALIAFILKYRRRGRARTAEGPQVHGATRLELVWTAVPVLILAAIAAFLFYKLPGIEDVPSAKAEGGVLRIKVDAHQFYWQYTYPDGALSFDTLYLPVDRPVELRLNAADVIHSWWVPSLTGKLDAIPGRVNTLRFVPTKVGEYEGKCAELCGVQHAIMYTDVQVVESAQYEQEVSGLSGQSQVALGKQEWDTVCAKCHGFAGEGDIGPAIAGNGTLTNFKNLSTLIREEGQNTSQFDSYMPAVGQGWTDAQVNALIAYIKSSKTLSTAAPPAGGSG